MSYSDEVKCARMDAFTTKCGATAVLEICSAGYATVLATIPLANPIAPPATGAGLLVFTAPRQDDYADGTGTAAIARIRKSSPAGDITRSGLTVGAVGSGANIELDNTSINENQLVRLVSMTITHAV